MSSSINTIDLEDMLSCEEGFDNYLKKKATYDLTVAEFLTAVMIQKDISRSHIISKAGLNRVYSYEVFRGEKRPSRNILLRILIALEMDFEKVQIALKKLEYPLLYAKNIRDAIIIYGLKNNKSVDDICILLYDSGQDII